MFIQLQLTWQRHSYGAYSRASHVWGPGSIPKQEFMMEEVFFFLFPTPSTEDSRMNINPPMLHTHIHPP